MEGGGAEGREEKMIGLEASENFFFPLKFRKFETVIML